MIALKDILYKVTINAVVGSTSIDVSAIDFDSRKITDNNLFLAIRGTIADGHNFIDIAIEKGAKSIVCETLPEKLVDGVTYVEVDNSSKALAVIASNFYNTPSENLRLVGVTGTNGKNDGS